MGKNGSLIASEILVVDDEEDIRDLICGILADEGYATRAAEDSESALAAVRARRPQLLILDIWLQGSKLDGIQVLDVIKREQPDLPVDVEDHPKSVDHPAPMLWSGAVSPGYMRMLRIPLLADPLSGARSGVGPWMIANSRANSEMPRRPASST